jgi:cytochrome c oxidase subunit 2
MARQAAAAAPDLPGEVDLLFYTLLGLSTAVILGVLIVGAVFALRYRRGSPADRTEASGKEGTRLHHRIEWLWIAIPLALFLATFAWGAVLYSHMMTTPADALEVYVVGKQWMWELQHPQGRREIDELHVPRGVPIRLVMTSQDVIHSFYIPSQRIKQDVVPGRYLTVWFRGDRAGRFRFMCAEYCGTRHSGMHGWLVVMEPPDYERWLHGDGAPQVSLAQQGRRRFEQYGCSGCHDPGSAVHAPPLAGIFGGAVALEGGGTAQVDERYIHDSILTPRRQVVAGYAPIMPSFAGQISEAEIVQIIAYVKSLAAAGGAAP